MLIRHADLLQHGRADVRLGNGLILEIGRGLRQHPGEGLLDADGAALLPGLHDHHIHLRALAAAMASVACGPPQVTGADSLAARLRQAAAQARPGDWIRGVGYHESVAGELDRHWLDRHVADRPVRIQHRSGRLWVLNSPALERIGAREDGGEDPLERRDGRLTGRLYDADAWLRARLGNARQDLSAVSRRLAGFGVTGVTDTTPGNTRDDYAYFRAAHARGELLQDVLVMGDNSLDDLRGERRGGGVVRGPRKFHLHDADLPELGEVCAAIEASHAARRPAAFHCVTRAELVFALVALREAGCIAGDRIEHAAVTPPDLLAQVAELGLIVVTQPNFIAERGDAYLRDVDAVDRPWLYRLRGFLAAGVALAGSTDAPFGDANPWKAMQAAVDRRTAAGAMIGAGESLGPEEALNLFLAPLCSPGQQPRALAVGASADLCLLDRPWAEARQALGAVRVQCTFKAGALIWPAATGSPE
ncbi:MAG TPA: amidohydrolase family protein [Nevskiales bacterium]|nr:amidohydrolase family protein [Nevskiales bacterium]